MSSFSFIALGDMPYRKKDLPAFDKLIAEINHRNPRFVVHLGDMKGGPGAFKKDLYVGRREIFSEIKAPFIYTPGDNDWVDGRVTAKGMRTPATRLKKLRQVFYDDAENTIDSKLWIIRQDTFVENAWWTMNDILFLTLHTIGKNNNRTNNRTEFNKRNKANLEWLANCVGEAPHHAIVVFTHANLWHPGRKRPIQSGFAELIEAIGKLAADLSIPVLVMHGDKHKLLVDSPSISATASAHISSLTRVQVMGDDHIGAVEVMVHEDSCVRFGFETLTV